MVLYPQSMVTLPPSGRTVTLMTHLSSPISLLGDVTLAEPMTFFHCAGIRAPHSTAARNIYSIIASVILTFYRISDPFFRLLGMRLQWGSIIDDFSFN